jgi:hypothetical protein
LATILDTGGVQEGDRFLDIGSGDGALVLGTSLLYANESGKNAIHTARGLEIVPGLYQRSLQHRKVLNDALRQDPANARLVQQQASVEFFLGDIHNSPTDKSLRQILHDTTLAVCFAATSSTGNARHVAGTGARTVVVDGRLNQNDGPEWQGGLRVECPDTAPSSIASLYIKI